MPLLKPLTNQRLRLFAVALMVGTLTLDAVTLELHYLIPDSVQPSDSNFKNNPAGNGEVLMRLSVQKGKATDLIFIGASNVEYLNTEGSAVWDKY
jgi:hypothetical protein